MKKRVTYILVVICFVLTSIMSTGQVSAKSINDVNNEINKLEKESNSLKNKQGNINNNKNSTENKMDENLTEQSSVEQEVTKINDKLINTKTSIQSKETEIDLTNKEIAIVNEEIAALKNEIIELEVRIKKREELLKNRLRAIQKNGGNIKYMDVILGSQSIGDFISRSSAVNVIMDQDKTIMEEHAADIKALEDKKVEVEDKKVEVESKKAALEQQKNELVSLGTQLDSQVAEKESLIDKLGEEFNELEELKFSLEDEEQIIAEQAAALEKAKQIAQSDKASIEEEARAKAAKEARSARSASSGNTASSGGNQSNTVMPSGGSGEFIWPTSGRVSSGFGYRTHPISGGQKLHAGIDIAAGTGTPVRSAASGVVGKTVTGCSVGNMSCGGGYGNYILVTHVIGGKTFTTLYAHLSSVNVSPGQVVSQGTAIGGVGNTGGSKGAHLHFEVHPGGYKNPVNPLGYLK